MDNIFLQIFCLLGAIVAWSNGLVISGYNGGHGGVYDYAGLEEYEGHAVLPTVAVPVHSVSASPLHLTAQDIQAYNHYSEHQLQNHHHHHHHQEPDHDYYVSKIVTISRAEIGPFATDSRYILLQLFFLNYCYKQKVLFCGKTYFFDRITEI